MTIEINICPTCGARLATAARYMLVVLASKRARQINRGATARVTSKHYKPTSMALEEIAAAKVEYRVKDEGDTAKV